jgi:tubulin polyglutamylase TTLL1/tubulin monoglycylase TTLL3/8
MPDNPLLQEAIVPLNQPVHQYKCYVGKGNNSILIRTLFKTRFWWLLHDKEEIEKVNFMWTQLRKNAIMDTFPCKFEEKKSGLKTHSNNSGPSL